MSISFIENPANDPIAFILLAHGAMAPMDSRFMDQIADLLVERKLSVARFEFAYMAARRGEGKKRPPPRAEKLQDEYVAAVGAWNQPKNQPSLPLLVGGKSLGGRVASMVADKLFKGGQITGLTCLGYPFHPPAKPENLRTAHLESISCPTLILQGERDPFGNPEEISTYGLSPAIRFHWVGDGDHDFGPRGRSGFTKTGNLTAAADAIATFAHSLQQQ